MSKKLLFDRKYNYYKIIERLRKFAERAYSGNMNEASLLRAELLRYIFSIDFLAKIYLDKVNEAISFLEKPNSETIIDKITRNAASISSKLSKSTENDDPIYLYYPSVCTDESKIIVQESLMDFYCKNFSLSAFSFDLNLPHIEYYILSKPLFTSFFTSPNFDVAYLNTINLSVIIKLIYYIEYRFAFFYYDYNTKLSKKDLLKKINKDKHSKRLKQIIKTILQHPNITLYELTERVDDMTIIRTKRDLEKIAQYAYRKGELNVVKELAMTLGFVFEDLD